MPENKRLGQDLTIDYKGQDVNTRENGHAARVQFVTLWTKILWTTQTCWKEDAKADVKTCSKRMYREFVQRSARDSSGIETAYCSFDNKLQYRMRHVTTRKVCKLVHSTFVIRTPCKEVKNAQFCSCDVILLERRYVTIQGKADLWSENKFLRGAVSPTKLIRKRVFFTCVAFNYILRLKLAKNNLEQCF